MDTLTSLANEIWQLLLLFVAMGEFFLYMLYRMAIPEDGNWTIVNVIFCVIFIGGPLRALYWWWRDRNAPVRPPRRRSRRSKRAQRVR